ncbi:ovochymase-1 isoform X2 [Lepisosteus oculatus]|uniref:ovochymase-1 isoform X2 n=1 Tax=Lepisosteus oculatus TaxID=7918 RepID=UPI0007402584|nr:PREDICTED: transmembrane protease serine 9-like isoform X1 [Lepisosteus oculatus]
MFLFFVIWCLVSQKIDIGVAAVPVNSRTGQPEGPLTLVSKTLSSSLLGVENEDIAGWRSFMPMQGPQDRIVGGMEAWAHSWPWQACLKVITTPACGGAIIGPLWVLTAAHCFNIYSNPVLWKVLAGKHDLDNLEETCQQTVGISRILRHKDYDPKTHKNDIALLKLEKPLDFNNCVRPVLLPTIELQPSKLCTVTGWGTTSENGPRALRLQEVNITILDQNTCNSQFYSSSISAGMVCAGRAEGGKDACQGDSGGPLSCEAEGSRFAVGGLVSWGVGCARREKPGVYTDVFHFLDWISDRIQEGAAGVSGKRNDFCGTSSTKPCGMSSGFAEVVGLDEGRPTVENVTVACPHSWPWQVSLQSNGQHFCSGTLIHPRWVLAARHCDCRSKTDDVVLGAHDLTYMPAQIIRVDEVYSLADNGSFPPTDDLTLVRLQTPARLGDAVAPACLPDESVDLDDSWSCVTTGWGSSSAAPNINPDVLRQARIQLVNETSCRKSWGEDLILKTHICAGAAGSRSCMGISGGALVCSREGVSSLWGVLTWGSKTCTAHRPAVFTRVSAYRSWIKDVTWGEV